VKAIEAANPTSARDATSHSIVCWAPVASAHDTKSIVAVLASGEVVTLSVSSGSSLQLAAVAPKRKFAKALSVAQDNRVWLVTEWLRVCDRTRVFRVVDQSKALLVCDFMQWVPQAGSECFNVAHVAAGNEALFVITDDRALYRWMGNNKAFGPLPPTAGWQLYAHGVTTAAVAPDGSLMLAAVEESGLVAWKLR